MFFCKLYCHLWQYLLAVRWEKYIMSLDSLRETACVVAPLRRRSSP
jgi:hypothetical protein